MSDTIITPEPRYVHLHVHDVYSVLDGISRPEDLIAKCKKLGMNALARTNHGNMFQSISFYKSCVAANIKPILGTEFYVAPDSHLNRTYAKKSEAEEDAKHGDLSYSAYHLTVLAKNREGYENLKKLNSIAYRAGFYRKPRIDDDILAEYKGGLIVLSGCLAGKIAKLIVNGNKERALEEVDKMRGIFGEDFYLEVMNHNIQEESMVVDALVDFGKQRGIPLVMTGDSHFTEHGDEFAHGVALAVGTGTNINDPDRFQFNGDGYWFRSPKEMYTAAMLANIPEEALTNTAALADRVEDYAFKLVSQTKKSIIPLFRLDENTVLTDEQCILMLEMKARQGLAERKLAHLPEYQDRLKYELDLIAKKNFSSYFLIISDIIDFMRKNNIVVPIGRGSSLGALTCYSLFITGLDPVRLKIPFSRFINEGRKDLPDIDTDISQIHRQEVIKYIVSKYGKDRVAHIVTFQSMAAKAASDNVGRGLGIPSTVRAGVGKLIGEVDKDDTLEDILKDNPRAKEKMSEHKDWISVASKLEGNIRNLGAHAAGIVISNDEIINHSPLVRDTEDGVLVTQYDMADLIELGMLKLDMLGLKTLDLIQITIDLIKERRGVSLDFHSFPMWDGQDPKTYATIASGKYVSCFQYDSHGIRGAAKSIYPTCFDHLVALNALYRPGPMKKVNGQPSIMEQYIERRHGRQAIETWHPELDEVFKSTYGLCIFQESVMNMAKVIAGFNDTEADEYRAAIGKKDKVKFAAAQAKFKERGIKMGRAPELMDDLIAKLEGFARYGWNVGHCLRRGTKVLTCARGYVEIQDIRSGEHIWSISHKTGHFFRNTVKNVINNGVRGLRRVTVGHTSIDCTDTHRFLTEKGYIHCAELGRGHSLKVLQQGAAGAYLNINMTLTTDGNEVPFGVGLDNIPRDHVMSRQTSIDATEHAPVFITGEDVCSGGLRQPTSFKAGLGVDTSKEFIYTSRINENALIGEPLSYSVLASKPRIDDINDLRSNVGGNSINLVAVETPLLHLSGEPRLTSLEGQLSEDITTTETFGVPALYNRAISLIRAGRIPARVALGRLGPHASDDVCSATNADKMFSAAIDDMGITIPSDSVGGGCEDDAACDANIVFSIHGKIIYDGNIGSNDQLNEQDEVWDLEMELDSNFIANDIVVHNSAAYSYISFVTAHLETHYPFEYYTTLLNVNQDDNKELKVLLAAIIQKGIQLHPPDVNHSGEMFQTDGSAIYMGLYSIRQIGEKAIRPILEGRALNGPYVDYVDFCMRMNSHSLVNKTVKQNLVKAGAFLWDKSMSQKTMVENTELIQLIIKKFTGKLPPEEIRAQIYDKIAPATIEYTEQEKLALEQSVLNFYISSHPVLQYQGLFSLFPDVNLITPSQLNDQTIGSRVVMLGLVEEKQMKTTKKGDPFLAMKLGDNMGQIQQNIWSPLATQCSGNISVNQLVLLHGKVAEDKFRVGDNQLSVYGVMPITATHGLPIGSFCAEDVPTVNRVLTILNATSVNVSERMLNHGHLVTLKGTAFILPEHLSQLQKCGRAYYTLSF